MSVINLAGLNINPVEATSLNEVVFEKTMAKPMIAEAHGVRTGIQMNTFIPFFGLLPALGTLSAGCGKIPAAVTIPTTQKQWTPRLIDFRLSHCQNNVNQDFKLWKRAASALDTWSKVANEQLAFIGDRTTEALTEAILRLSSFGDAAALNVAGGGVITNGVNVNLFTPFNGIWQQIFVGVGAGTIRRVAIAENGGATYAAQGALAANVALATMRALYEQIDPRAFQFGGLKFEMTRSLFNNWMAFLEDSSLAFTLDRAEQGASKYSYRGLPIVIRDDWDRNIRVFQDNGVTWNLPHRMILTPIDNVPVATSEEGDFSKFNVFFDNLTESLYIDVAFYLDAKMLEEYAIAVAY